MGEKKRPTSRNESSTGKEMTARGWTFRKKGGIRPVKSNGSTPRSF